MANVRNPTLSASQQRPRDGGTAAPAVYDCRRKIPVADLAHILPPGEALELIRRQADADLTIQNGDNRRNCPLQPDLPFHLFHDVAILWIWQAVGNHRGFQRNDRQAVVQGSVYFSAQFIGRG